MDGKQISDLIVDGLVTDLTAGLVDAIDLESDEIVGVVRGGQLQENPVKARLYVLVHVNDPDDPTWEDQTVASRQQNLDREFIDIPAFEVGGGGMWWRKGIVEFGLFATKSKETRDQARQVANMVKGRIEKIIQLSTSAVGITDSLGEFAVKIMAVASRLEEGGGPPRSFIWRGRVRYQVLTNRPY